MSSLNINKYTIGNPFETDATVIKLTPEKSLPNFAKVVDSKIILTFSLNPDDMVFGLGEQTGGINKRGKIYKSFCSDECNHSEEKEALYGAHNFIIVSGDTKFGLFIDFPGLIIWDICYNDINKISIEISRTYADIYLVNGNTEKEIIKDFRTLIGNSYIPPMWAFGFQQSRWSYNDYKDVDRIIKGYEQADMPLDAIYMDIDYMVDYKDFTIDEKKFPHFENYAKSLKKKGIRLIPIIDAGVKCEDGYDIYEEGKRNNYFCKNRNGEDFRAAVWPGICCFPDFLDKKSGDWFGKKFQILTDKGIEGFWIDMNEPALFYSEETLRDAINYAQSFDNKELGKDDYFSLKDKFLYISNNDKDYKNMYHRNGTVNHYDVHNLYGYNMVRAVGTNLPKDTLLFSRASYIGSHRYGGIWTGDNTSWFSHILLNLRMLPSLNMCGYIYIGADCGGFNGNTSRELLLRWMQLSVFTPLFRNHSACGTRSQECFNFENTDDFKSILDVRYRLVPYLYSVAKNCANSGSLMFSPLAFDYTNDEIAKEIDDQLIVNDDFMIAPVTMPNKKGRAVYIPQDMTLIRLYGNKIEKSPIKKGVQYVEMPLNQVVIFLKPGKRIPLCSPAMNVDSLDTQSITYIEG